MKQLFEFQKVDEWGQDVDFGAREGDSAGHYLHGVVYRRVGGVNDSPLSLFLKKRAKTVAKPLTEAPESESEATSSANPTRKRHFKGRKPSKRVRSKERAPTTRDS